MARRVVSWIAATAAIAGLVASSPITASAQVRTPPVLEKQLKSRSSVPAPASSMDENPDADRTRGELMDLLRRYPPSVGRVLKLDPSLLANPEYLDTYPALKTFLAQHPDVGRNPGFYFQEIRTDPGYVDTRSEGFRMWDNLLGWMGGLSAATLVAVTLGWLIRLLVDYRRWYRLSKVQAEAHGKLLDRLTANEEVLAYVQSPAGSRFLESAPIALDPGAHRLGAPFGRIFWSLQAGIVLTAAGLGLRYLSSRVDMPVPQPFLALGVLAIALGLGFIVSAGISYALSKRLGLFEGPK